MEIIDNSFAMSYIFDVHYYFMFNRGIISSEVYWHLVHLNEQEFGLVSANGETCEK